MKNNETPNIIFTHKVGCGGASIRTNERIYCPICKNSMLAPYIVLYEAPQVEEEVEALANMRIRVSCPDGWTYLVPGREMAEAIIAAGFTRKSGLLPLDLKELGSFLCSICQILDSPVDMPMSEWDKEQRLKLGKIAEQMYQGKFGRPSVMF